MKECVLCGGSALRDYAYGCDHKSWDEVVPGPPSEGVSHRSRLRAPFERGESLFFAEGHGLTVYHPLRGEAVREWRERYAIGLMVDALFRKLTGWAKEGEAARFKGALADYAPSVVGIDLGVRPSTSSEYVVWTAPANGKSGAMARRTRVSFDGWPDNRTPEEMVEAEEPLVGRKWVSSHLGRFQIFWEVLSQKRGRVVVGALSGAAETQYNESVGYFLSLMRDIGAVEITQGGSST